MARRRERPPTGSSTETTGPEPRPLVRLLDRAFGTVAVAAVVVALLTLIAILQHEGGGLPKRPLLWATVVLGVLVGAIQALVAFLRQEFAEARSRRRARKEARLLCQETRRILRRSSYRIKPDVARDISEHEQALRRALLEGRFGDVRTELGVLDELVDRHLAFARKSTVREYAESIGVAVLIALLLRSFVVEAFKIPSGSMIPTLQVGDHIFVNKFIYGLGYPLSGVKFWVYGKPRRGDVIVFKFPREPDKDFIKRVIGIEGDTIHIRDGYVHVNGKRLPREHVGVVPYTDISDDITPPHVEEKVADEFHETLDDKRFSIYLSTTYRTGGCPPDAQGQPPPYGCREPVRVPSDTVFVMGDNRDNSHDSRFWGFVPDNFIKGKALFIWYSGDPTKPFPTGIRLERLGHVVK